MKRKVLAGLCWLLLGCQTYTPQPLDPEEILKTIEEQRRTAAQEDVVSLAQATQLMLQHSPRVRDTRAARAASQAFADVKTPLPNPSIEVFPGFLDAAGLLDAERYGVDAVLGWTVLLSGRRRYTDDVNAIRAEAAWIDVAAVEREEYLGLRGELITLASAVLGLEARRDLQETVDTSLAFMKRLVDAALATALDVREFELESYQAQADVLEAEEWVAESRSRLAMRTGVPADVFRATKLPLLPADVPALEQVHDLMIRDNPELARLRAEYAVAEKELRLEVSKQYPDLDIRGFFGREEGDNTYGIGFGIEIPLFDRNQPGIAAAHARRDQVRTRFGSQVTRGLAGIGAARRRLMVRRRRLAIMHEKVGPTAEQTLELARRMLASGAADALRVLTVLREQKRIRIELLQAELEVFQAWGDLEAACGLPLLRFPDEPGAPGEEATEGGAE
ncbi:MAG: TolC family protein [Planctomycetota bacterium]